MIGPFAIYVTERIVRFTRSLFYPVIVKVVEHPSKVMEIQFRKRGFHAEVGQYVFLNCPKVAFFEWHPMTLTSVRVLQLMLMCICSNKFYRLLRRITLVCTYVLWETGLVCGPYMYYIVNHMLFSSLAQLSKALGVGRGDTTQAWQLPSIAVDGPFGTASEVSFYNAELIAKCSVINLHVIYC